MDDSAMYTGVDQEPSGMFDNEPKDDATVQLIQEQERLVKELTPKLQDLLEIIDNEIASVMSIDRFVTAATQSKEMIQAELQAAALYKGYLDTLKTKFVLALNEVKKK
jgi:uncharacterized protein YjcR